MAFSGYSRELPAFLQELKANNDKAWFDANRARFDRVAIAPSLELVAALAEPLSRLKPALHAVAKVNGSIRRIHRDTRFSKDKRPYNTHVHLIFWAGDHPNNSPGVHLLLGDQQFGFGAGLSAFGDDMLACYRSQVAGDGGKSLAAAVAAVQSLAVALDPPALARVPPGYEPKASGADWLRYKGLVAKSGWRPYPPELFSAGAVDYVAGLCAALSPINRYLAQLQGGGPSAPRDVGGGSES